MTSFILFPDPLLQRKAEPAPVDAALLAVGESLRAAAVAANAYGLAGAHIGEVQPVIVINLSAEGEAREDRLLFNPQVLAVSAETEPGIEGSVSMPGVQVEIERPLWADLRWQDETGAEHTQRLEGFAARVALHEIEQMNGVFFLARFSRLKREMAIKKFRKGQRG